MELKDNLKQLRKSRGITQQQLADAIFISRSAVAKWENGLGLPNEESMEALERCFGIRQSDISTAQPEQVIVQKNQRLRQLCSALGGSLLLLVTVLTMTLPFLLHSGNYGFTPEMAAGIFADEPYIETGDYRIYYTAFEGDWEDGRHWVSLSTFRPVRLHFWGYTVSEADYTYDIILHNNMMVGKLYSINGRNGCYNIIRNSSGNMIDSNIVTLSDIRVNGTTYHVEYGFFFVTPEPVECFWLGDDFYYLE